MKLLVLSHVFPYPTHDGGRFDIYYRLKALKTLGHEIYLVAFYNPIHGTPPLGPLEDLCKEVFALPYLRRHLSKVLSFRPYYVGCKENTPEIARVVTKLQNRVAFDAVIAESMHMGELGQQFLKALKIPHLILRMHNDEPRFMRSLAKTSPTLSIERAFFFVESIKFAWYEKSFFKMFSPQHAIWHISEEEYERYKKHYPKLNHHHLPAAIDLKDMQSYERVNQKNVLFVGALFSPNNLHALKWYLKKIHPTFVNKYPDYRLLVAGNSKGANETRLKELFGDFNKIDLIDTPEDLDLHYRKAQVFINPMLFGAGVKLKTLHAALKGVPIVSTVCGNEGTGLKNNQHLLVANTPAQFIEHMEELFAFEDRRKELAHMAQNYLRESYNQVAQLRTFSFGN